MAFAPGAAGRLSTAAPAAVAGAALPGIARVGAAAVEAPRATEPTAGRAGRVFTLPPGALATDEDVVHHSRRHRDRHAGAGTLAAQAAVAEVGSRPAGAEGLEGGLGDPGGDGP